MNWFRFYTEAVYDRKLRRLPPAERWLWVVVLTMARQSPEPGRLLLSERLPVRVDDLADAGAMDIAIVESGLASFTSQNMMHLDGDVWVVTNWEKRQFEGDNSSDRVKQYRDKRQALGLPKSPDYNTKQLIERDGGACVYCGSADNLCIDHIFPVQLGGTDDDRNLAAACKRCNSGKAGRTPEQARYSFINEEAENRYRQYYQSVVTVTPCNGTVTVTGPEAEAEAEADIHTTYAAQEPEEKKPLKVAKVSKSSPREDQVLFAALKQELDYGPGNDIERGKWNKAIKVMREATPPVLPQEVPRLHYAFRQRFQNATCTPMALASNVGLLRSPPPPPSMPSGQSRGRKVIEDAPATQEFRASEHRN